MDARVFAWMLLVAGLATMLAASGWAPAQPELVDGGAACQVAQCGTLEDPPRWRAAWWLWAAGFSAVAVSAVALAPPIRRVRRWQVLAFALAAPLWTLALAPVALIVSWATSVHGAATVLAWGAVVPVLALLAGLAKARTRQESRRSRADDVVSVAGPQG